MAAQEHLRVLFLLREKPFAIRAQSDVESHRTGLPITGLLEIQNNFNLWTERAGKSCNIFWWKKINKQWKKEWADKINRGIIIQRHGMLYQSGVRPFLSLIFSRAAACPQHRHDRQRRNPRRGLSLPRTAKMGSVLQSEVSRTQMEKGSFSGC